jgi:hypothetical protein
MCHTPLAPFPAAKPHQVTRKHRNAKPDGPKPRLLQPLELFRFLFWFDGDFIRVSDDVVKAA